MADYKGYDQKRTEVRKAREEYGSQWISHLDRYGPASYFYELAGILGRVESMVLNSNWEEHIENLQDKLVDMGNYASFLHDWLEHQKVMAEHGDTLSLLDAQYKPEGTD